MKKLHKNIVAITFILVFIYFIAFNLNVAYYWGDSEKFIPQQVLSILWLSSLILSVATLILCIQDSGKRHLENRADWIVYMILFGAIGLPHYYFKHDRHPRD